MSNNLIFIILKYLFISNKNIYFCKIFNQMCTNIKLTTFKYLIIYMFYFKILPITTYIHLKHTYIYIYIILIIKFEFLKNILFNFLLSILALDLLIVLTMNINICTLKAY